MSPPSILEQLKALQKEYFVAIDEAYQARTVLGDQIFETMRWDLFQRYLIERDQLKYKAKIPDKNIDFETKLKIRDLTPHRCGFLWLMKNEARTLKERETNVDVRIELDARTSNVEMLEDKIYPEEPPKEPKPKRFSRKKKQAPATPDTPDTPSDSPTVENVEPPAQPSELPAPENVEPPAPPARKPRKANLIQRATPLLTFYYMVDNN